MTRRTSLPLMYAALALAGLGTALLGPILPALAHQWHMLDSESGLLMAAKFCGAFLGGVTVTKRLERTLLVGFGAAAVGFGGFAMAPGWQLGAAGLALGGFGLGRIITATNILAGKRFTEHRGSALARLNLAFTVGAMMSALGAAWLLPRFALRGVLECFAGAFALVGIWLWMETRGESEVVAVSAFEVTPSFDIRLFAYFAALLFLYGGLETCLAGWITTFAQRYGDAAAGSFVWSEYTTFLLWMSLSVGRAISVRLMMRVGEKTVQRYGLAATVVCVGALTMAHGGVGIAAVAALIGLSLSAFFPATFALLMAEGPTAGMAGMVIAASGLGAASLPWLMGVVSTRTGSLVTAVGIPLATAALMLVLSLAGGARTRRAIALKA
jgi:FHS family glucose/mannose:H+ symporter-like MFS transporter